MTAAVMLRLSSHRKQNVRKKIETGGNKQSHFSDDIFRFAPVRQFLFRFGRHTFNIHISKLNS